MLTILALFILLSFSFSLKLNRYRYKYRTTIYNTNNDNVIDNNNNDDNNNNNDETAYKQPEWNTFLRQSDLQQDRDLDLILTERAQRFYDPKVIILLLLQLLQLLHCKFIASLLLLLLYS